MTVTFHPNGKIDGLDNANYHRSFTAGHIVQAGVYEIPTTYKNCAGSWAAGNTPTSAATYSIPNGNFTVTRKSTSSKMIGLFTGAVDLYGHSSGVPSVISLTEGVGGKNAVFGSCYHHVRVSHDEPLNWDFGWTDDFSTQSNSAVPAYSVRVHTSGTGFFFNRRGPDSDSSTRTSWPTKVLYWEVAV